VIKGNTNPVLSTNVNKLTSSPSKNSSITTLDPALPKVLSLKHLFIASV